MEVELDDPSADPDWFKFNPPDKNFDLGLKDYSKKQISLSLVTPMNLPAVILTGRLKFYYYNFEPKVIRFTYDIKAASVVLETKLSKNNFGVKAESCSPDGSCIYEKVIENYISLFNKGKKDLLNIKIGTLVACRDLWILFPEITYLESLPAGQKEAEKVPFVVTAPPTAKDEEYQRCVINIEYTDPDGGTNTIAEGLYIRAKR
jgi:hypothetical protein